MENTINAFRAGLWSPFSIPKEGVTLQRMVRFLSGMMVTGKKPKKSDLMREIRHGRWSRKATPCPEHLDYVTRLDPDKLGTLRAIKIAPNRWVLRFTS